MANEYYLISFINLPFLKMVPNDTAQRCFCPIQLSHNIFSHLQPQLTHKLDNKYDKFKNNNHAKYSHM